MTLKNAVTKGVKAWRDRRVGYWLCIDLQRSETAGNRAVGVGSMPRRWLLHSPDPGWPRHHRKGRKRGFRRRGVSAGCGSGTQGDRINRGVFWHGTKRPNFRFRGRRGPLRSRIRVLPPRDPPGDGGRREGGRNVFEAT